MTIRILVDSACDVPPNMAERLGISVVPVYINIGNESYLDGVDLTRQAFYENLPQYDVFPTTAAPAPGAFTTAYEELVREGATEILSLHIAAKLSNTLNAARLGADDVDGAAITIWDTQQLAMGGGLQAIIAAEAAAAGCTMPEILGLLREKREKTRVFAMLDTLEFLRRSGRVTWTEFGLGTVLRIKPLLSIYDGTISVIEKVRTSKRAISHLVELVESYAPVERIVIEYGGDLQMAQRLQDAVAHLFPPDQETIIMELTPAIGAHAGPGVVGVGIVAK